MKESAVPGRSAANLDNIPSSSAIGPPKTIARYRIERVLGKGGFGLVYLAHDDQLQRLVAIKVPHQDRVSRPEDAETYLAEARTVASLDHPNIVPVHDVGGTEQFPCFVVSKYINGTDLATRLKQSRLSIHETVELLATVAEALHYAHRKGLVHRDIKPANILIDTSGKPYVADFGLALKEEEFGRGATFAGTPAYMSPEQARGEGHRVDGRSDIFSLGVVFYELLTGRRPFKADSQAELLEQISSVEARPPRQVDDHIPKELERICLKTLSKRASERYTTAKDLADDLRHCLGKLEVGHTPARVGMEPAESVVEPKLAAASGRSKAAFLSYATPDKEAAYRLGRLLEEQGIGCWIAPRDVPPGADYGEAIIQAIEGTATTVLLLSAHANSSVHVKHEVERATSKRKRLIPVRLEDVQPSRALELHLATAHWVDAWRFSPEQVATQLAVVLRGAGLAAPSSIATTPPLALDSDTQLIRIVPKGLRSFDAHDADFFLELLPGPRDREGLPDSLRFWKTRLEATDADNTFSVGLIYGPSGCGKSSLVKAGLLPRLSNEVIAVYVEATAEETETRVLNGLRKRCPNLPHNLSLKETLAALRRGQGIPSGKKVLIVLDQFEQWLHAKKEEENTELVQALRQCDGQHVQCIIMVRDDFWLTVSRFMGDLEEELVQGHNMALVDLFDQRHARKVLAAFGRAFGTLPEQAGGLTKEQAAFLDQAVSGLAQDGKVISVRLALFAEMVKGKPWIPATFREVGGTQGVGITFLEETFTSQAANPKHRLHQKAARRVLKALLPESGTDIKGHMRSDAELLEASGYGNRPQDFDDLIRILDSEIRLITPTDPEGKEGGEETTSQVKPGERYYQLTHDYLVPSLRDWLTRKQKETRKGRTELLLADRAAVWNARPENRQLPALLQWLQIRWFSPTKNWTQPQRKMMRAAGRFHGIRSGIAAVVLLAAAVGGVAVRNVVLAGRAATLVEATMVAPPQAVPYAVENLSSLRVHSLPILRQRLAEESRDGSQRLHAAVALAHFGEVDVPFLVASIPQAHLGEFANIVGALRRDPAAATVNLKAQFATATMPNDRFRLAAMALQLGEVEPSQKLLALAPDPSQRTLFIHHLYEWRGSLAEFAPLLQGTDDADFQSGLCQAIGQIPVTELTADERRAMEPVLKNLYADSSQGSVHSAARWTMQQWKLGLPKLTAADPAKPGQDWYVNPLGMTFLKVPAGSFDREAEDRTAKKTVVTLSRAFWLGDCEVTRKQFETFIADPDCPVAEKPKDWRVEARYSFTANHPVNSVSWFDAVLFCNWLSRREGLRPHYERTGERQKDPSNNMIENDVWRSVPKSEGYRLPIEAEWEYACRAKSATIFCFGDDESLLSHYAVYLMDTMQPVSSRQPNGWGLFDMHGNVWEWNNDWYGELASNPDEPIIDPPGPSTGQHRALYGGSFDGRSSDVRSANRASYVPTDRVIVSGFRLARSLPPVPLTPSPANAAGGVRE